MATTTPAAIHPANAATSVPDDAGRCLPARMALCAGRSFMVSGGSCIPKYPSRLRGDPAKRDPACGTAGPGLLREGADVSDYGLDLGGLQLTLEARHIALAVFGHLYQLRVVCRLLERGA